MKNEAQRLIHAETVGHQIVFYVLYLVTIFALFLNLKIQTRYNQIFYSFLGIQVAQFGDRTINQG